MRTPAAPALLLCSSLLAGCGQGEASSAEPAAVETSQGPRASTFDLVALYSENRFKALVEALACPTDERTVYSYDQRAPAAQATIKDALGEAAASAHVVNVSPTDVLALVSTDERVTEVLAITRWNNGGWAVDSGAHCVS